MAKLNEQESLNPKTPWLNADGTKKSEEEIKELGKAWSSETWNLYLDSEVGTLRDDDLVFVPTVTDNTYEKSTVLNFLHDGKHYEEIESALLIALSELSQTERFIIKESFWKMNSNKEIAERLGKTRKTVGVLKARAIKKLGQILSSQKLRDEILYLKSSGRLKKVISDKKQWVERNSLAFC